MPYFNDLCKHFAIILAAVALVSCGGGGGSSATAPVGNRAPIASAGSAQSVVQGSTVALSGLASADPDGDTLSYAWSISSKPAGSAAALSSYTAATPLLSTDLLGNYVIQLTVTDGKGGSATASVTITALLNSAPTANAGAAQSAYVGATVYLSGAASSDPDGDALTYSWTLASKPASSTSSLVNANTANPSFVSDLVGSYTAQLIVKDSRNASSSASQVTITVYSSGTSINNAFSPACSGANCSATSATTYSGQGVGVWRYNNTTGSSSAVNIDIAGVWAGKQVSLAFSNGASTSASSTPQFGSQVSVEPRSEPSQRLQDSHATRQRWLSHDQAKTRLQTKNRLTKDRLKHLLASSTDALPISTKSFANSQHAIPKPRPTPALNTVKSWVDYFSSTGTGVSYATINKHVCTLPSGRKLVFWQDVYDTNVTPSILNIFTAASCGANGGFAKTNALIGDGWGSHSYPNLMISDTAGKLNDINIVFVSPITNEGWAGYFYGGNNFISTPQDPSNEALAFFINTSDVAYDTDYYVSTLIHEHAHMVSFYQNSVARNKDWQGWMEETFAMMTEDIVTPTLIGYNKIESYRIPGYLASGGNVSLNNWVDLSADHYNLGGAFGAFLNRRYGLNVLKQLVTSCTTGAARDDAYICLNNVIVNNGGLGIQEEFAKFGTTVAARLPATNNPLGYGYPARSDGGYNLAEIDLSLMVLASSKPVSTYQSLSQTYLNDTVGYGKTRYIRNNVVVPAGTILQVLIQ